MPLKLVRRKDGRSPFWVVTGTHLGIHVKRSTKTGDRKVAQKLLQAWRDDIERGAYARPGEPTFASAALSYMQAGGERRFLARLLEHFGETLLSQIDQAAIDRAAVALYAKATDATRNRQVYSPVSAVLKHAGIDREFKRPKGSRGSPRLAWLTPPEAGALLDAAKVLHPRFGAMCVFLLYTGCRLSEATRLRPEGLNLQEGYAFVPTTKNGEPRQVHLPPVVVAALASLELKPNRSVFRLTKCGRVYDLLDQAATQAKVRIPARVAFHIFRHTYGAWMRRYAGADTAGLVATGAWKSRQAAAVYEHVDVTEEARRADLLPVGPQTAHSRKMGT